MSWLIVAIIARFVEGSSAIADKRLLQKSYANPLGYAFWVGIFEAMAIVFIPFGFRPLPPQYLAVAIASGAVFFFGILLYISALSRGEVSGSNTLLGALAPIATLLWSAAMIGVGLQSYQLAAFVFLVAASFLLFFSEKRELRLTIFLLLLASGACFGLASTLAKIVFLHVNFISGFITMKIGGALAALSLLVAPALRKRIISTSPELKFKNKFVYFSNRAYAGVGSILIYYAISLGTPALVEATAAVRYIFVFLGGWLLLREVFRGKALLFKILALILVFLGIGWLALGNYLHSTAPNPNRPISWGVTFSQKFSALMVPDWKKNYKAILNDLGAKHLRLIAYWDLIEPQKGQFNFVDLDYQMKLAEEKKADVILAVGEKVPRWPECHYPDWVPAGKTGRDAAFIPFLETVVSRYKDSPALRYLQIENEPFLPFGDCQLPGQLFLEKEIAAAKAIDSRHPILITDGGEFGEWLAAMNRADVFGTTMYRRVHNKIFGQIDYHLPPGFFRLKKLAAEVVGAKKTPTIVVELGAEPWLLHQLYETKVEDQLKVFDLSFFKNTISYAKAAGFDEYYLWGAEWWYWMKVKNRDSSFWDYAKTLFQQGR